MPDAHDSPFAAYLRRIDARLRGLPAERRAAIARELRAHLEDAADERGADPADPQLQQAVIADLGPEAAIAAQFGQVHGGLAWLLQRAAYACGLFGGMLGLAAAPLAIGLFESAGPLGIALVLALLAASSLGIAGVLRHDRQRPGGAWRVSLAATALIACGLRMFYQGGGSLDPLGGLALLVAGELLLIYLALSGPPLAWPRAARGLLAVAALLLVSFVSPFSALPNPLGAYYLIAGGYHYVPGQPLVNQFAIMRDGDPARMVAARLERLSGQTGLAPLDPQQPLAGYTLREVLNASLSSWPTVEVELRFADGSARLAAIPALDAGWGRLTSIDRLTAPHRPVPGLAPATAQAPLQLGQPARLRLAPAAEELDLAWSAPMQATAARWAPDGRSLLIATNGDAPSVSAPQPGLWLATLDGAPPRRLAGWTLEARWSADGRTVVALPVSGAGWPQRIMAYDLANGEARALGTTDHSEISLVGAHVYFLNDGALWRAALAGGPAERVAALPEAGAIYDSGALAVSPDGQRAAYRCWSDLCLADMSGRLISRLALGFQPPQAAEPAAPPTPAISEATPYPLSFEIAWSPDGRQLALATAATDERGRPALRLISRDGQLIRAVGLGPDGGVDEPQWLPDGRALLLTAYPLGGRRIVAVMADTGQALDLTRPHWDAFASLSPDGRSVLLWNGRGGFWAAPLKSRP